MISKILIPDNLKIGAASLKDRVPPVIPPIKLTQIGGEISGCFER